MVQAPVDSAVEAPPEGNIPEVVEATSPEEVVEAAPAEEVEAAPEEEPAAEAEPPDPLADLDDDALLNHPRVRDSLRKAEKSAADLAETRATKTLESRQRQWLANGEYVPALQQTIDPETGQLDLPKAQRLVLALQNAADVEAAATAVDFLRGLMPQDATISVADQNRIDRARSLEDKLAINYEISVEAGIKAREAEIRKEAVATARKEQAAAAKTAELRKAGEARAEESKPTARGVPSAGSPNGWTSQLQIHTAIANSDSPIERRELAALLASTSLPYQ